ncbi:MAG TPA: PadR family transcriptional regulator [Candidatus Dormibacteraeota bacterium]|nr:PadR family transcriptional regulator [Candidatus Dormibacteraeota bacterium]
MNARTRSTPYAVLGMLSLAPMSGYDIRKESESSIGYFWSESFGQIYPALKELKSQGLIRRRAGRAAGGRDRHVYEITEKGREALARWREEPPRPAGVRNELLLKLFFGRRDAATGELEWIEQLHVEQIAALREFRRIRQEIMKEQRDHPSLPFWLMTVSFGEHRARSLIRWCRETRKSLLVLKGAARKEHTP